MDSSTLVNLLVGLLLGLALGCALGAVWMRGQVSGDLARLRAERDSAHDRLVEAGRERAELTERIDAVGGHAVVKESLDRLHEHLRELEQNRAAWQSQLKQQVDDVRATGDVLRRETSALSTALRKPQVRGRWGELHLKRAVELAGMVQHCDFSLQVSAQADEQRMRPDLVVHLSGGKQVVVDAKVPLDAFLDATSTDDPGVSERELARHARQLRQHVEALAGKAYWRGLDTTPEFVVLFVPGEAFLSHALDVEPHLLEQAAAKRVILATPTTLIALLRTVAYAWTQEALASNAREVHALGRELYDRLATVSQHLDKLGRSLTSSVRAYNAAVGSVETRVLVSARRMRDLKVSDAELEAPAVVHEAVRPSTAAELLVTDDVPAVGGSRRDRGGSAWCDDPAVGE
ncbi:MAG: DNA recombination protein RmuC [Actinomycetota bacterium]|nr:DNA recombination protein RmuC [Actinomycetota bacterium]